jgi:integrase
LQKAGLPKVRFHALRHTFATRGLEAGVSREELQGLLGHETAEMVAHYQQLLDEQARTAMGKMERMF